MFGSLSNKVDVVLRSIWNFALESSELSRSLQKYTHVFFEVRSAWRFEFGEKLGEVLTGELPFERSSRAFPVVLKVQ